MKKIKNIFSFCLVATIFFSFCSPSIIYAADASIETVEGETELTQDSDLTEEQLADVNITVASAFSVQIPKMVTLDGETRKAKFNIGVKGDIGSNELIYVEPEWRILLSQENKGSIPACIDGHIMTAWGYGHINKDTFTETENSIIARQATAGEWTGLMTFNIELCSTPEPGLYTETGEMVKSWDELVKDGDISVTLGSIYTGLSTNNYTKNVPYRITGANKDIEGILVVPYSVGYVLEGVFKDCTKLIGFDMSAGIYSQSHIQDHAFENCTSLKYLKLPKGDVWIRAHAFKNCISLTDFPSSQFLTIAAFDESNPFTGCAGITSFKMPIYWDSLSPTAGLTNVTEITCHDGLAYMSQAALEQYPLLNNLILSEESLFKVENGVIVKKADNHICASLPGVDITAYTIPENTTRIYSDVFKNRPNLTITYKDVVYTEPAALKTALEANGVTVGDSYWTIAP